MTARRPENRRARMSHPSDHDEQTNTTRSYPDWKAPAEDSQMLNWPDAPQILSDTIENHRRLSAAASVRVQNVALPDVRARQRAWIGHSDDAQPLMANGHQTELHHVGVWVKNVLIGLAAEK